jgi:uncharacterized membrane protein
MQFILTMTGSALSCALELFEAMAIVLAVAVARSTRDALLGAGAATVVCAALALVLGPLLIGHAGFTPALQFVIGCLLLLIGLEWLRKGVLRLAGRRARSSSFEEYEEEIEILEREPAPAPGRADWTARTVAFQGVLLEGTEVILIVTALAARPGTRAPALLGAALAVVLTIALGVFLHRPLRRVPETELKYVVGIVLSTFGTFLAAEGLGVHWPLGDGALLVLAAGWLAWSQALMRRAA